MNRQMWQPSVAETNFSPVKMISSSIYPGGPVRDEINKSAAVPPVQQPWTMPDKGMTIRRRMTADPFERLHGSPTKMLSQRGAGLIPSHKLTGELPPPDHVVTSTDFFKPDPDRPRTSSAPLRFAHEFNVTTSGSHVIGSVEVASPGPRVKTTDSRVVKHNCSSMQGAKGSPEKCARGVSRNPLGGFYTT